MKGVRVLKTFLCTGIFCLPAIGCTLMVDEYNIVGDASVEGDIDVDGDGDTDGDTDGDGDSDADGDGDAVISCGHMAEPPAGDDIEFCRIADVSYFVGCDEDAETCNNNEIPKHRVNLTSYQLQKTEVTTAAFRQFVMDKPEWAEGGSLAIAQCDASYLQAWDGDTPPAGTLQLPVLGVCWYAAKAFCDWLGGAYRLPTEAEWETAARGGNDGENGHPYWIYPFEGLPSCGKANYSGCQSKPLEVGSLTARSFGVFVDMAGNAWEWVQDWYRADYYCDPDDEGLYRPPSCNDSFDWSDPNGPTNGTEKVLRGGSWFHDKNLMRAAGREYLAPSASSNMAGFRCASD